MGKYNKRKLGNEKEQEVVQYLIKHNYNILECNYSCRQGEIDIIAMDGNYLVFVEVKYRSTNQNGYPMESVTKYKQRKIIKTAQYYMYAKHIAENNPIRFDVASVLGTDIFYIKNAFETI